MKRHAFSAAMLLLLSAAFLFAQNPSCPRPDCPNQGQCQGRANCPRKRNGPGQGKGMCDGSGPRNGQNWQPDAATQGRGQQRRGLRPAR